ncbi:MAG: hypothetical protein PUC33_03760, partial [Oscillospiraceae bacterium]|nr:hypothetical protein [Oscillospiraceae bacterium]
GCGALPCAARGRPPYPHTSLITANLPAAKSAAAFYKYTAALFQRLNKFHNFLDFLLQITTIFDRMLMQFLLTIL